MLIEILIAILFGVCAGIVTGLIPGVHINLIAGFILSYYLFFLNHFSLTQLVFFIVSMSLVHTFLDFIPSLVFGVPDSDTALSILPGHKLILEGRGFTAIHLSALGSLYGTFFAIIISPIAFFGIEVFYNLVKEFIPYILILTIILLILFEKSNNNRFWAFIIVLFSAGLGSLVLNSNFISDPLLVLFTGLFGVSSLLISLNDKSTKFPPQKKNSEVIKDKNFYKSVGVGGVSASLCSVTPGIGNAQAGTISALFFKDLSSQNFIVVLSAINTINFIVSIITFQTISKARNGSIFAISQLIPEISVNQMVYILIVVLMLSFAAYFLTLRFGKIVLDFAQRVPIKKITVVLIVFLILFVGFLGGFISVIALFAASSLGILCISLGVRRVHLMASLLVPIIFNLI